MRPLPDTMPVRSLHALLEGLIDYAGLFPPARLPLDAALAHYARDRQGPDAWMLARFICPVGRLADLASRAVLFEQAPPFRFSMLGTGGADAPAFLAGLRADLNARHTFHRRHPGRVVVDLMEVRLPAALYGASPEALGTFFQAVHDLPGGDGSEPPRLFFEIPLDGALRRNAPAVVEALAAFQTAHPDAAFGLKMRCGGVEAAAFPPPDRLAYLIRACLDAGLRFKATAGLHHPLRHYNDGVGTRMHGFLNVFGGAVLAAAHNLDEATLCAVLEDEDPTHFLFTDDAFRWQDLATPLDAIRTVRARHALSFGSCSFDEPRDDLRALGLL